MKTLSIDGHSLKKMIIAGANNLNKYKAEIDALNVFPVPDGDTGTNMAFTVMAAANEVAKIESSNIHEVAKAASGGALRGARGNSGVILSQLFRGFAKGLEGKQTAAVEELAVALQKGSEMAYKAVMKPKEGTVLTIARTIGENAYDLAFDCDDIEQVLRELIKRGYDTLAKTTEMLAELKQAGVVDAGGKGLLLMFEGAYFGLTGQADIPVLQPQKQQTAIPSAPIAAASGEIEHGYCTEFFVSLEKSQTPANNLESLENELKAFLEEIGDSIVVVADEDLMKVHVHTNHPGAVLERAMEIGSLSNLKIENMRLQHTNIIDFLNGNESENESETKAPWKDTAIVTVSIGDGFNELFVSLGADGLIEGGQSLNPSTEEILNAINKVNADNIIVLPNNKNIIPAAEQAKEICEKNVYVLKTRSLPQGLTAIINFNALSSIEENIEVMSNMINNVNTGQVTCAVRSTVLNGQEIKEGDYIGIFNGDIVLSCDDLQSAAKSLIDIMIEKGGDLLSVYYGEDVSPETAEELLSYSKEERNISEVEIYNGKQPLYHYIISME